MGMEKAEETLNKSYTNNSEQVNIDNQSITMLAVPKSWTRLVIVLCVLLFMVVTLVTFMVWIQYRTSQRNTDRILEQSKLLCEARQKLGLQCLVPTPSPTP